MQLHTTEHYDLMAEFEKRYFSPKVKPLREDKQLWPKGRIYCDDKINTQFIAFRDGYALAKCVYQQH